MKYYSLCNARVHALVQRKFGVTKKYWKIQLDVDMNWKLTLEVNTKWKLKTVTLTKNERNQKACFIQKKENKPTWICQTFHYFMERIRTQTHLTSLTSKLIWTTCVLAQLQSLDNKACNRYYDLKKKIIRKKQGLILIVIYNINEALIHFSYYILNHYFCVFWSTCFFFFNSRKR